ncbi:GMP/IMP nucleotidase [Pseudoalteromonas sp. MMG010]|uniref:GMP/IMP nucleotidase n=1 Tax=Pseudoalteromonas sp. MMG010 TaxID=2822685 RepID=UPI001B3A5D99|nr:GMP/IMP nucleotidase [Pseudoalteromonas sp. MMG010]MBQ4834436.1 GMP/IMP nucleotidase [Pseudoalteromonas sp. MMG010]
MLNWSKIDTVLLDMDGTLLDLHFDSYFWLNVIPEQIAITQNISLDAAKADIAKRYQAVHGQIQWYCLDYWQEQLKLPIMDLKREHQHLIKVREDVPYFLTELRKAGKELILLTNAHPENMVLKFEHTAIDNYLDGVISTHQYGVSKEQQSLWHQVHNEIGFDKQRTLFVDDSEAVLNAAKDYGIAHLLAVANPDSQQPSKEIASYLNVTDYRTII